MKRIGLIGGMSWESTVPYYEIINKTINKELGNFYSADCILHSINFQEIEKTISKNIWEHSNRLLSNAAKGLQESGCDFLAICSNTMHKCIPAIEKNVNIPILHIVDATTDEINKEGIKKVLLLGTKYTMEEKFHIQRFHKNGIQVIVPKEGERNIIHKIIFDELCKGKIKEQSRQTYKSIIQNYCPIYASGVVLGCTEIGLLIKQKDLSIPVFDTTKIHAKKIALYAIERK